MGVFSILTTTDKIEFEVKLCRILRNFTKIPTQRCGGVVEVF